MNKYKIEQAYIINKEFDDSVGLKWEEDVFEAFRYEESVDGSNHHIKFFNERSEEIKTITLIPPFDRFFENDEKIL